MRTAFSVLALYVVNCILGGAFPFSRAQEPAKSEPLKPENIQGCYALTLSAWRPNLHFGEDSAFITPPNRIQLFAERGTEGWESQGYLVKPAPGTKPSIHRGAYWSPKSSQSIQIVWTTGFSGLVMVLKIEGSDLLGEAKSFWDFPRPQQTAGVTAHKVGCQATRISAEPSHTDCREDKTQPKIIAGEGWGQVRIGTAARKVDALLGKGRLGGRGSHVYFKDYVPKGIQVSFKNDKGTVYNIYFYNQQRASPQFGVFCGQVEKGINWQSSVDDVKAAYGPPTAEYSGTYSGETWRRLVFDGIDFRFENEKMVRIGIPGN